jgi:hypothetical protein
MNRIPLMLDSCEIEVEYDYSTPNIQITGVYIAGYRVKQIEIIDAILDIRGINELEQEIRDTEFTARENEEFLRDNRWPDKPRKS